MNMEKNIVVSYGGWNKKITFSSSPYESDAWIVKRKIKELLAVDKVLQQLVGGREFLLQAHDMTVDMMTNIDDYDSIPDRARVGLSIIEETSTASGINVSMPYSMGSDYSSNGEQYTTNGSRQAVATAFDPNETRTNLIINYLPQQMPDEELDSMFMRIGPLKSAKIMRDKATGYSFGYGFVEYVSPQDASRAISKLNGFQILHKRMKVSYARPAGETIKGTNLYVVNLPMDITQDRLDRMFGAYGTIVQSNLLMDMETGLPRGIAFVRFDKKEEAEVAMKEINGFVPAGAFKEIIVKEAKDRSKEKQNYYMGWQAAGTPRMARPPGRGMPAPRMPRFRAPGAMRHMRPTNRYNPMALGGGSYY